MKIFVVDDDPAARAVMADQLGGPRHELREFADGPGLLAAMGDAPDLVLLDIGMPGMDGIAACRALQQAGHDRAQVVFVSSHDDLETRLAAYDAGGSDFIAKPFAAEELAQKVRVAEICLARRSELSQQARTARQTAFTAMSSMGEMGVVLEFLRASFACADPGALARAALDAARQFDLPCLLQLRLADGNRRFSSKGECSPLEASILDHAANMDHMFQFHDRLAINFPAVTLLVQGLPLDDTDRVGRLRDHLAIFAEGIDARLKAMEVELRQLAQARGIGQAVTALTQALEEIGRNQAHLRVQAMEIDAAYLEDLVHAFVQLGLSEDQESALAEMAQRTHKRLNNLRDDDFSVGEKLKAITDNLRALAGAGARSPATC